MRICLVSPGHLATNPRLVKEALAFKDAGHEVQVVCGCYNAPARAVDRALAEEIGDVTPVLFGPYEAKRSTYLRQTMTRRFARLTARAGCDGETILELAHSPVVPDLCSAALRKSADLYIAHYVAALPAVAKAAARHGARFAFDAEDFHHGELPDSPAHALERKIIRSIEGRYLPTASHVTAASPLVAEEYAKVYNIPVPQVILNVFPKANAPAAPSPRGTADNGPSIYWFSQTIGPGRGIEAAIEAMAIARSTPHLYLRGTSQHGYAEQLRRIARRHGVDERLHFLAIEPPAELERLGAAYDLGYVGELADTRNRQIALTNKLFSYLLGGVPTLASDIAAHRQLAPEFGDAMCLFAAGDSVTLAAAMDAYLLDPSRLASARLHAWRLGQDRFNWDAEQRKLIAFHRRP